MPCNCESTRRIWVQPYGGSYFLPGKIAGKVVTFLLDSGCTTNLLSRQLFETLSARDKAGLEPYDREHGMLTDGSCVPFYGIVELTGRVRDQAIQETLIVSQLKEDAILRIPFLMRHECHIDFSKSAMVMAGQELIYVDKFGRLLVRGVQVVRNCTIPGCSCITIRFGLEDGSWRFCVDYRKLNSVTYPLPRIDESLDTIAGSKYFSILDLLCGYWQVSLSPDVQNEAVFKTRDRL